MRGIHSVLFRTSCAAVVALSVLAAVPPARAQVASIPPSPDSTSGWTFAVAPYAWLPTISTTFSYTGQRGATVTTDISAGIGDYISKLNFGLMVGGEARYDRFSIMTDLVYVNASLTTSDSHLRSVNLGLGPIVVPREIQRDTGTRLAATIWSLAGGYTLLQGGWGNLDAVAGLRMLFIGSRTNYTLTEDVLNPDQTIALSRDGSLSVGITKAEGVGGVTGRIIIPNSRFYLPFYLDAGGGSVPFTWEAYGGIAYQAANWVDVSLGYRYLAFENGNQSSVQNLRLGGVILAGDFRF